MRCVRRMGIWRSTAQRNSTRLAAFRAHPLVDEGSGSGVEIVDTSSVPFPALVGVYWRISISDYGSAAGCFGRILAGIGAQYPSLVVQIGCWQPIMFAT